MVGEVSSHCIMFMVHDLGRHDTNYRWFMSLVSHEICGYIFHELGFSWAQELGFFWVCVRYNVVCCHP